VAELSYVAGISDVPLMARTIGDAFDRTCALHADREAVVSRHQGVRLTYRELGEQVGRAARALLAIGVEKGDRVGIWSPNSVEWIVVQYATAKIGAILVNVNPAYRTHELEFALRHSAVSTLITAPGFRSADYLAMIDQVRPTLPELRDVFVLGDADPGRERSWSDVLSGADQVTEDTLRGRSAGLDFDEAINIQYTSGTTGFPKGATLSHHNILNNGFFVGERLRLTPDDRVCLPVPFYHCFGMVLGNLACLTHGSAVVIPAESFNAGETLAAVDAERCTAVYGVPTMFIAMLEHPEFGRFELSSLRTGIMAGSPCPVEVMRQAIDRMHLDEVTICYGMTETSPVSFQSHVTDDIDRRVSTVGSIHPWVESKLVDPATGQTVPRGTTGELCSRGYLVMLGYWNDPAATSAAIDQARWMHTGDLAVMRDDGYVNIVGRLKDMVIRGGENVYPREIEEFLYGHPKIADVQVIGVPDARYGEELCAWIKLRRGETATEDEIRDFCRGQIATFKIPRYVRFTDEFPVTITGKVQKYRMREISTAELGLEDAAAVVTA
jgi:fatty-acyl-CoA synthase